MERLDHEVTDDYFPTPVPTRASSLPGISSGPRSVWERCFTLRLCDERSGKKHTVFKKVGHTSNKKLPDLEWSLSHPAGKFVSMSTHKWDVSSLKCMKGPCSGQDRGLIIASWTIFLGITARVMDTKCSEQRKIGLEFKGASCMDQTEPCFVLFPRCMRLAHGGNYQLDLIFELISLPKLEHICTPSVAAPFSSLPLSRQLMPYTFDNEQATTFGYYSRNHPIHHLDVNRLCRNFAAWTCEARIPSRSC